MPTRPSLRATAFAATALAAAAGALLLAGCTGQGPAVADYLRGDWHCATGMTPAVEGQPSSIDVRITATRVTLDAGKSGKIAWDYELSGGTLTATPAEDPTSNSGWSIGLPGHVDDGSPVAHVSQRPTGWKEDVTVEKKGDTARFTLHPNSGSSKITVRFDCTRAGG